MALVPENVLGILVMFNSMVETWPLGLFENVYHDL